MGWSYKWCDECFKREGIDKMLENKEIEALFFSHEHFDHFWGLPVALKYDPEITIYIPEGFYPEGLQYIKDCGHKGKLITVKPGLNPVIPGMASYVFAIPIICRVYGEQSLYFNVAEKGLVSVTGCCHQGHHPVRRDRLQTRSSTRTTSATASTEGLHISPFDDWDPKYDDLVISLGDYGFERIGCNHCTGVLCAKKFITAGYPVIEGTARFRSKDKAYLGNGGYHNLWLTSPHQTGRPSQEGRPPQFSEPLLPGRLNTLLPPGPAGQACPGRRGTAACPDHQIQLHPRRAPPPRLAGGARLRQGTGRPDRQGHGYGGRIRAPQSSTAPT